MAGAMTTRRARLAAARTAVGGGTAARDDVDVLGLDGDATLATILEMRAQVAKAQAIELRAVAAWADRHRITDPEDWLGRGAVSPDGFEMACDLLDRHDRRIHEAGELGTEGVLRLGGEGAFAVREFAVTDLAVLLGMSEQGARDYVGQTVELRDRLPRMWGQVMSGVMPVWKARRIAEQTIPLGAAAAGFVDAQLHGFAHRLSITRITRCVDAAILRFHPDLAARKAAAAAEVLGVWLEDDATDGTTRITGVAETPDAHVFDRALTEGAGNLKALGDSAPLQTRRARALGVLADPQYALDLHTAARTPSVDGPAKLRKSAASPVVHLHLHTSCHCGTDAPAPVSGPFGPVTRVRAEGMHSWRPGPVPTAVIERWLTGFTPGTKVTVTPVVDLAEQIAVDAYEHPVALVRQVAERDHTCSFPWCGRQGATYDLDHITPYLDPDDGGPPGQTSTANTARLCRYHHRVKTHGAWDYRRTGPTALEWTSPQGRTYAVDHTGTRARG